MWGVLLGLLLLLFVSLSFHDVHCAPPPLVALRSELRKHAPKDPERDLIQICQKNPMCARKVAAIREDAPYVMCFERVYDASILCGIYITEDMMQRPNWYYAVQCARRQLDAMIYHAGHDKIRILVIPGADLPNDMQGTLARCEMDNTNDPQDSELLSIVKRNYYCARYSVLNVTLEAWQSTKNYLDTHARPLLGL